MSDTGKFLRRGHRGAYLFHWCPGCKKVHSYAVSGLSGGPVWTFNGNFDVPAFSPSMRISSPAHTNDDGKKVPEKTLCHYYIVDTIGGQKVDRPHIQFQSDCPHELNGQTVPLPEWPYAPGTYGGVEE